MKEDITEIQIVPYDQSGNIHMREVPVEGLEITGLPRSASCKELNVQVRNHSSYKAEGETTAVYYIFADVTFLSPISEGL